MGKTCIVCVCVCACVRAPIANFTTEGVDCTRSQLCLQSSVLLLYVQDRS